jgi:hypothetical protein
MTRINDHDLVELIQHDAYSQTYSLLDELTGSRDLALTSDAASLLGEALLELTDYGAQAPAQAQLADLTLAPGATHGDVLEEAFRVLDRLLSRLMLDTSGLSISLRLTRVRDLVHEARRAA